MLHLAHLTYERATRLSIIRQLNFVLMIGWACVLTFAQPFETAPAVYTAMETIAPQTTWGWLCFGLVALGLAAFVWTRIVMVAFPVWISWWAFTASIFAVGSLHSMAWMMSAAWTVLLARAYADFYRHPERR